MVIKIAVSLTGIFFSSLVFSQPTAIELFRNSYNYYFNKAEQTLIETYKFKSAISPDTTVSEYNVSYQKRNGQKMIKYVFKDGLAVMANDNCL